MIGNEVKTVYVHNVCKFSCSIIHNYLAFCGSSTILLQLISRSALELQNGATSSEGWCWRTLLRVPWTARRSNQSILKEISPEYSLVGLILKLKLNTLATWWEELTYLKRHWFWERLKVGGEGDDRGWGGWMASLTQWAWIWVNSGSGWYIRRPGVLKSMGLQRLPQLSDWTELNWTSKGICAKIAILISVVVALKYKQYRFPCQRVEKVKL